ncbi:MAG: TolC family protein [Bacteroidales bacterium]|nr:TolC family protein [Bacteroidales bacterium]
MKLIQLIPIFIAAALPAGAQATEGKPKAIEQPQAQEGRVWTMEQCMAYAVEHSTAVRTTRLEAKTAKQEQAAAMAEFFPSVAAQTAGQYSWGRNIDPETNTYNNVTTFGNSYGLYASVTLFDGGRTINRWKQAKVTRQAALNSVQRQSDDKAIEVMMAFVDVVYYNGAVKISQEKLETSRAMQHLTEVQEELGIKGLPDVATAKSQTAADEYTLVHNQNLYNQALLTLATAMNLPTAEPLQADTALQAIMPEIGIDNPAEIYAYAIHNDPTAIDAKYAVEKQKLAYRISQGELWPTISLEGGVSTSYYKTLNSEYEAPSFGSQFKNNRGEYIYASLRIPLFSNLSSISSIKRSRNQLEAAKLQQEETLRKLYNDIAQAVMDRDGFAMEIASLSNKADADALAYILNSRKYAEGLLSLIDLQLSANTLYQSRLDLLQRRMLYVLKDKLVNYYKGIPLINE